MKLKHSTITPPKRDEEDMLRIRIQEIAQEKNISRTQIAKRGGLDYKTVQRIWEDEFRNIDLITISRLCDALDVSPGELLERLPDNPL